jgi:exonuclease III
VEKKIQSQPNSKGKSTDEDVIAWFANTEPTDWKPSAQSKPTDWAQAWANDILPMSTQAHERLEFSNVTIKNESAYGDATEKTMPDGISYTQWSGQRTEEELHKAGWRLAAIIEASLNAKNSEIKKPASNK